jgi:anti-anti-sigma factor
MEITTEHLDDIVVFRFNGKPQVTEWEEATDCIISHYEKGDKSMIVNWLNVDYIDTNSLQILVRLLKIKKDDSDFHFSIVSNDSSQRKLLEIFGFDKLVDILVSEDEALEKKKPS